MSKRSDFARRKNDAYLTPKRAVPTLIRHLPPAARYVEPCAANGGLVAHLGAAGMRCVYACDIDPQAPHIEQRDALTLNTRDMRGADMIITNPPWTRSLLHPMVERFVTLVPEVWLLFDGDWLFTVQSGPLVERYLTDIVPLPRLKWIPDSKHTAKDNCAWFRFRDDKSGPAVFHRRM